MTFLNSLQVYHPLLRRKILLLMIGVLGLATTLGLLAARQPLFAIAGVLVMAIVVAVLAWPDVATLVVMFVIYSNAAAIAVRYHGVPSIFAVIVPMLLMIPLASYLIFRREKLIVTPVFSLLFLYLLVQVIGTLTADYIDTAISTLMGYVTEGILLYLLVTNVVRTPRLLRLVIWSLLLAGGFLGFLSVYQQLTHTYTNDYWGFAQMSNAAFDATGDTVNGVYQKRLAGPIGDQNYYAQLMLMLVPVGFFRFLSERSTMLRVLALVATGLIAAGAMMTFSRGAAVGFVLMIVIVTLMGYIKPYQVVLLLLGIILLMTAVPQYATRINTLDRLSNMANQDTGGVAEADSSIQSRLSEMLTAGLVFIDHPVVGVGPGTFKYYYPQYSELVGLRAFHTTSRAAHDLYIGMAAETGFLGVFTFLAIVFVTLRQLARLRKRCFKSHPEFASIATGYMISIVSFLATGLFLSFAYERYFWLIIALAGAVSHVAETALSTEAEPVDMDYASPIVSQTKASS
jgi:putative inorganic carbon (HCO3(-)) transporter